MPEQITPTHTRALGFGCGAVALAVLISLASWIVHNAQSTDYATVAPEKRARQVFRFSQEAYDALGFGAGAGSTFSAGFCYDNGPLGVEDKTVDGAYRLSHEWALDHVPESQAVPGLRRLSRRLAEEGWKISDYRAGGAGADAELFVQRDGGDERMWFTWYADREYFDGGASVPCAYVPGPRTDSVGSWDPDSALASLPEPVLGPSPAR
ncbi:hypothetical protein [Streptomyces camelliae]|uniref:Uncharacterized protein n=1 Tax=Streptomyces camelliae TaxID=3004093 RepID=A0ABY7P8J6_9ACTN|nr:hypothetical protein [Streptomyces sp. HUAS 2-6]WBO64608.1 hypothetical protein O1G22_18075 [Streptomyces sp. HUAS 2-6]